MRCQSNKDLSLQRHVQITMPLELGGLHFGLILKKVGSRSVHQSADMAFKIPDISIVPQVILIYLFLLSFEKISKIG